MRWLVLLALVAGGASCRKEPRGAVPVENRTDAGVGATRPAPDAGDSACVTQCVHDNQMRATSIEEIQRECRAQCAEPTASP